MKNNIKQEIFENQDIKYRDFQKKLLETKYEYIGVRIPTLRTLSNKYIYYIDDIEMTTFEEVVLKGLMIGKIKNIDKSIKYIKEFVPYIDSWAICDTFVCSLKITLDNKDKMFDFITKYKDSKKEYELRFLLVMLLNYYIEDKYIDKIFEIVEYIDKSTYYVKMAVAWLLSMCYIKKSNITIKYLKNNTLDDFTLRKTISKINDSYRVEKQEKEYLKKIIVSK